MSLNEDFKNNNQVIRPPKLKAIKMSISLFS